MEQESKKKLIEILANQAISIPDKDDLDGREISINAARRSLNDKYNSLVRFSNNIENITSDILEVFKKFAEDRQLKIGNLKIILVGGRLKEKPIDLDTDIDLFFVVDSGEDELSKYKNSTYLFTEVMKVFRKHKILIKPDDFHFSAIMNTSEMSELEEPFIVLMDSKVN